LFLLLRKVKEITLLATRTSTTAGLSTLTVVASISIKGISTGAKGSLKRLRHSSNGLCKAQSQLKTTLSKLQAARQGHHLESLIQSEESNHKVSCSVTVSVSKLFC